MSEIANFKDDGRHRVHYLRSDARSFSLIAGIFIVGFLLLIMADRSLWKDGPVFYGLLALRISVVMLGLGAIFRSLTTGDPATFDRWAFAFGIYVALTNNLVILSRPAGYLYSMVPETIAILLLFAAMPDRFLYRVLPPVIFSVGSLLCFFTVKEHFGFVADLSVVLAYLTANLLGIRISSAYCGKKFTPGWRSSKVSIAARTSSGTESSSAANGERWACIRLKVSRRSTVLPSRRASRDSAA